MKLKHRDEAIEVVTLLSTSERSRLTELESIIKKGLPIFLETGRALLEIRDRRLYRGDYPTFEKYCSEKLGMSRSRAYQLMQHVEVQKNLSTVVDKDNLPIEERVTRSLSRWLPDRQIETYQRALKIASGKKITSQHIAKATHEWKLEHLGPNKEKDYIHQYRQGAILRKLKYFWKEAEAPQREKFLRWIKKLSMKGSKPD
jgi:hypothetical protein